MSDYFDGLLRSSGLPLSQAPVIAPSMRGAAPAAALDLEAPMDLAPAESSAVATARPIQPAFAQTPAPAWTFESVAPNETSDSATSFGFPPTLKAEPLPAAVPASVETKAALARPIAVPATEPAMTHERMVQAAMRWIAAEPAQDGPMAIATPERAPYEPLASDRPRQTFIDTLPTPSAPAPSAPQRAEPASARPNAVSQAQPPSRAVAAPMERAMPAPAREEAIQVSIGAIHLRVEAPAPPALHTTVAPRPPAAVPTTPRSGLSRRALRGF